MTYTPNECYIEVWREANFRGESRRIYGPAEHAHLHFRDGDWANDIGSLRVGPHAFVFVYRGEKFQDAMQTFGPNDTVADLSELKFDDDIDSMRLISSLKIFERLYADGEEQHYAGVETLREGKGKKAKGKS